MVVYAGFGAARADELTGRRIARAETRRKVAAGAAMKRRRILHRLRLTLLLQLKFRGLVVVGGGRAKSAKCTLSEYADGLQQLTGRWHAAEQREIIGKPPNAH
jgi:hypothetical protein